ncbi:MAG: hypothetical protein RH917_15255 [Lacipirellulaceae bacterium]
MNLRKVLLIAALVACPLAATEKAQAQCGGFGAFGLGAYADVGNLYRVLSQNVPYYSAFPPVYYSYPVPRTYGHSPFAYLPTHVTPEYAAPAPLAIDNPYMKESQTAAADSQVEKPSLDQTTSTQQRVEPLAIVNPYAMPQADAVEGPILQATYMVR